MPRQPRDDTRSPLTANTRSRTSVPPSLTRDLPPHRQRAPEHRRHPWLGGDYGGARLALLLLALPYVGARRLEHLQYLVGDPLVRRFAGLARVPTARTVSNWLRRFTQATLRPLVRLNQELVLDTLARLNVPRLTLDVDGTIVRTGATVAWAFRGFNPHHRKEAPLAHPGPLA